MKKPPQSQIGRLETVNFKSKHQSKRIPRNSGCKLRAAPVPGSRAAVSAMVRENDRKAMLLEKIETTPQERIARLKKIMRDMQGNDAHTQASRILLALEGGPATTIELRRFLDIMQVSTRVYELRQRGFHIETHWVKQSTDVGKLHRVALYGLTRKA
jgi:Helix-turn-helix domain